MTVYAYRWRCPRCGATYESPIAVMGVTCGKHKGGGVAMKADDGLRACDSTDMLGETSDPGDAPTSRDRGPNLTRRSER